MRQGASPENSSWMADMVYVPLYTVASVGLAKLSGIIKSGKRKGLEETVLDN